MMKTSIYLFLLIFFCFGQKHQDILYLKNGSVIYGIIIEQKPNSYLKIKSEEEIILYRMDEIAEIKFEGMELIDGVFKLVNSEKKLKISLYDSYFDKILNSESRMVENADILNIQYKLLDTPFLLKYRGGILKMLYYNVEPYDYEFSNSFGIGFPLVMKNSKYFLNPTINIFYINNLEFYCYEDEGCSDEDGIISLDSTRKPKVNGLDIFLEYKTKSNYTFALNFKLGLRLLSEPKFYKYINNPLERDIEGFYLSAGISAINFGF